MACDCERGRVLAQAAVIDGHAPCKWCNDEGVVHTHDGEIIGPCECAVNDGLDAPSNNG